MNKNLLRFYYEPEDGSGRGAGGSSAGGQTTSFVPAQTTGNEGGAEGGEAITTPWDSIDLDTLDAQQRSATEAAIASHREMVTQNRNLQANLQQQTEIARRFQSQHDQLAARLAPPAAVEEDPYEVEVSNFLRSKGYSPDQIKTTGPLFAGLFKHMTGTVIKGEIGRDLTPLANTVVGRENHSAFETAQNSEEGQELLAIPEIAQAVWEKVAKRTSEGFPVNPETILNLAKMDYYDHQRRSGGDTQRTVSSQFPNPAPAPRPRVSTALTFPGAGAHLRPSVGGGANTGGTPLNSDTQDALTQVFGMMENTTGIAPAAYKGAGARIRGGNRR